MSTTQKDRRLLDEVHDIMRLNHYSIHMVYTHVLQQGGHGVISPLDDLAV